MTISFEKLWQLLASKNMLIKDLQEKTGISSTIMAKMRKNQDVSTRTLLRICIALNCDISDIMEIVKI